MAYSASNHYTRVNYYSNPNVIYPATGTPTVVAGVSYNARLLVENRMSLAAIGDESSACASSVTTASPETTAALATTTVAPASCYVASSAPKMSRYRRVSRVGIAEKCHKLCRDDDLCDYWAHYNHTKSKKYYVQASALLTTGPKFC